jgi:hypothetical protein
MRGCKIYHNKIKTQCPVLVALKDKHNRLFKIWIYLIALSLICICSVKVIFYSIDTLHRVVKNFRLNTE